MNKDESKAYLKKVMTELGDGVSKDDMAAIERVFDNDKFLQGWMPTPEFSRGLDKERATSTEFQKRNEYLEKQWFPDTKAKFDAMVGELGKERQRLSRYVGVYGQLDDDGSSNGTSNTNGSPKTSGINEETLQRILAERDRATLDLVNISADYRTRFKKELDTDQLETFVRKQREAGRQDSLKALYKDYIEPEVETASKSTQEARDKQIREEAIKDYAARHNIPVDSRPKEVSILNERIASERKAKNPDAGSGRDEFLKVMNDPDPSTVKQRYG